MVEDVALLPLPTAGYDLYVLGEVPHGALEVQLLTAAYLRVLHRETGLRDLVLELPQVYERPVEGYVLGESDSLPSRPGHWLDLLQDVRAINKALPETERIRVHLTDVDSSRREVHAHLESLAAEIDAAADGITIPSVEVFEGWSEEEMLGLAEQLVEAAGDREGLLRELVTVKRSIRFVCSRPPAQGEQPNRTMVQIREGTIERNIAAALEEAGGGPVLALYGGWHTQKQQALSFCPSERPWVQRLTEAGARVYSVVVTGMTGSVGWEDGSSTPVSTDLDQIRFSDGTTLKAGLEGVSGYEVVYVNLGTAANAAGRLGALGVVQYAAVGYQAGDVYADVPAGQIYDGVILFRRFSPVGR